MPSNAMVAVCDVLGFGDYVKNHSLDDAITYIKLIQNLSIDSILKGYTPEGDVRKYVGYVSFSDTIVLYSLEDNSISFDHLILTVFRILAASMFHPQYRFRIGISYGEFHFDNREQIYVGKALVDAHELERKQKWCGAALSQMAFEQVRREPREIYLMKYNVPLKNEKHEEYNVINWTLARHDVISAEHFIKRNYTSPLTEQEEKIEYKLKKTEQFHTDVCIQCRKFRKSTVNVAPHNPVKRFIKFLLCKR